MVCTEPPLLNLPVMKLRPVELVMGKGAAASTAATIWRALRAGLGYTESGLESPSKFILRTGE